MTTYILHGGKSKVESPENDNFFKAFTGYVNKETVNILMCFFSRPAEEWMELLKRDQPKIEKQTTKKITISIAENPADLLQKLDTNDVLYVAGGDAERIEPLLPELKSLKEKLNNKVYLGSSMGAFIVSENYVLSFDRQRSNEVHKGLGLLPISTLCHWNIETKKDYKVGLLKHAVPHQPILMLNECQFASFVM